MADSEVDTTQQVTSTTPVTKIKNPKRVAAGKAIAEKTKQAREAQRKKLAEADVIIANSQLLSVVGIYYKREEIKNIITKKPPQTPPPSPAHVTPPPVEPQIKGGIRPMD